MFGNDFPPPDHFERAAGTLRWKTLVLILTGVVLLVGVLAVANRNRPAATTQTALAPPPSGQAPPERTVAGISVGHPRTEVGAESAAANYAVAYGSAAMFQSETRRAVIDAIVDPAVRPTLAPQLDEAFAVAATRLGLQPNGTPPRGLRFVCRTFPLGTRVVNYQKSEATVEVWTTGVIGLAGLESPTPVTESWQTVTITLRWADNNWKLTKTSQRDGPTPILANQPPSSGDIIADAVTTFGELRYAG